MIETNKNLKILIPKKPELNSFDLSMNEEDISQTNQTNATSNVSVNQQKQLKYKLQIIAGHFESQSLLSFLNDQDRSYEEIYQRNNFLKEKLDFTQTEKNQFTLEIVDKMRAKKILGSKVYWGFFLGLIIGIICLYFLSNVLPLYLVLIISVALVLIVSGIGYWMKNKIKKFQLLNFDEKLINEYSKWTKKKLYYYQDDINKRRILMENFISKYQYCKTHSNQDCNYLQKIFLKNFQPIFIKNKKCVFLSLRIFFNLSQRLQKSCCTFINSYYNQIILPLKQIFEGISGEEPGFKELQEILEELCECLNCIPQQSYFQIGKHDPNLEQKSIFITDKFSLFSSHESFLKFNNIWEDEQNLLNEILNYKLELSKQENQDQNFQLSQKQIKQIFNNDIQLQIDSIFSSQLFQEKSTPMLEKLCDIAKDSNPNFKKVIENSEMKIEKIQTEESPVVLVRATIILETKAENLFKIIHDLKWRTQWDKVLSKMEIIEVINDSTDILYSFFKSPMGVSNRDFLQKRYVYKDTKNWDYIMVLENCIHPKCPVVKDAVRAETIISGYLIKQLNDVKTTMTVISQTDIKGMVPSWIVNFAAQRAPIQWLKKIKEGIKLVENHKIKD